MLFQLNTRALVALVLLNFTVLIHAQPARDNGPGIEIDPVNPGSSLFNRRSSAACNQEFRILDGTCTNPTDPTWASTGRTQFSYLDDHSSNEPVGGDLPSAREISNRLSSQSGDMFNDRGLSELVTFFGQFLDHTLVSTPLSEEEMDIEIPPSDPIFSDFPGGVLRFERSTRGRIEAGSTAERPINVVSAVVDLSTVYGSDEVRNAFLRGGTGCKMATSAGNNLPFNTGGLANAPTTSASFFIAGDTRVTEHPVLGSLHTIFLREHNFICDQLAEAFPDVDEERLYEFARLINGAEMQKIVFTEFFPAIVGRRLPRFRGFQPREDPTSSDIFTTAAFRVGHTMVGNGVSRAGPGNSPMSPLSMEEMFFSGTRLITSGGIEPLLRGAMTTRAQEIDVKVHDALRNFLFTNVPAEIGFDLVALNLQRGRDHALPTLNEIRGELDLRPYDSIGQITNDLDVVEGLTEMYGTIDRVEAWIGLVAEDHLPRSSLGETMVQIWRREFVRLRDGDRFFYLDRRAFPAELRSFPMVRRLRQRPSLLREIILRNSDITAAEIGSDPFRA